MATLWDDADIINHRAMIDAVHRWGALAGVELFYAGGLGDNLGTRYASTAMHQFASRPGCPSSYTYEAEAADLRRIVQMHGEAAARAVDAGFDIVYLHGTHGALPVQVLSRHFNRRTDGYGGSFENRARLWVEILEAMRQAAKGSCASRQRFSIDQLSGPQGIEAADEGLAFVELCHALGLVDLWDVNISSLQEWGEDAGPSRFYKTNHQAPWTREVKKVAKVPVVDVGRFTDPDEMVRVLRSGQCDIIGCARPSIADPWLPRKIDEGRARRHQPNASAATSASPASSTAWRSSARRIRRRWRNTGAAGIRSGSSRADAPPYRRRRRRARRPRMRARARPPRLSRPSCSKQTPHLGGHLRDVVRLPGLAEWGRVISWRETAASRLANVRSSAASAW